MRFVVYSDATFYFLTSTVSRKKVIVKILMLIFQEMSILRSLEANKMFETNVSVLSLCGPKARGKTIKPISLSSNFPKPVVFARIDARKVI